MLLADVQRCLDLQCIVGVFSLFSPMFRAGHAFFFLASPCHHQEKISQFGLPLPSSVDPITGEGAGSTLPSSHPNTGEGSAAPAKEGTVLPVAWQHSRLPCDAGKMTRDQFLYSMFYFATSSLASIANPSGSPAAPPVGIPNLRT